jgi:hypothetical protein
MSSQGRHSQNSRQHEGNSSWQGHSQQGACRHLVPKIVRVVHGAAPTILRGWMDEPDFLSMMHKSLSYSRVSTRLTWTPSCVTRPCTPPKHERRKPPRRGHLLPWRLRRLLHAGGDFTSSATVRQPPTRCPVFAYYYNS